MSTPVSRQTGSTCAANASFSSTMSTSSSFMPAWASALGMASIGATPMISGSLPLTAEATMRARGRSPSSSARARLMTMTAAAPSLSGQALPAVTVPPSGLKDGCELRQPLERGARVGGSRPWRRRCRPPS